MRFRFIVLLSAGLFLLVAGCSDDDTASDTEDTTTSEATDTEPADTEDQDDPGDDGDAAADEQADSLQGSLSVLVSADVESAAIPVLDALQADNPNLLVLYSVCSDTECVSELGTNPISDLLVGFCGDVVDGWLNATPPPVDCEVSAIAVENQPFDIYTPQGADGTDLLNALAEAAAA